MSTVRAARLAAQSHSTDLVVSGVETVEAIGGGLIRVTYFVNRNRGDGLEREAADFALVMPASALPDGIGKAIAVTARVVIAGSDGSLMLRQ